LRPRSQWRTDGADAEEVQDATPRLHQRPACVAAGDCPPPDALPLAVLPPLVPAPVRLALFPGALAPLFALLFTLGDAVAGAAASLPAGFFLGPLEPLVTSPCVPAPTWTACADSPPGGSLAWVCDVGWTGRRPAKASNGDASKSRRERKRMRTPGKGE
jgi:hypothetical protein